MICPHCLQEINTRVIRVTAETVTDIRSAWLQDNAREFCTEEMLIVSIGSPSTRAVQSPESRRYAASSLRDPLKGTAPSSRLLTESKTEQS